MRPASAAREGELICGIIEGFSIKVGLSHEGQLSGWLFIGKLIHAGVRYFGLNMEISLEAIGEAVNFWQQNLSAEHFTDVYYCAPIQMTL